MSYETKKSGHVISNEDYKKLDKKLQGRYVASDKKVPSRKKSVERPSEVQK
jgi:hypothetical protein